MMTLQVLGHLLREFLGRRVDGQERVLKNLELGLESVAETVDEDVGLGAQIVQAYPHSFRKNIHSRVE